MDETEFTVSKSAVIFSLKSVDLVFGGHPERAFQELNRRKDRDEIHRSTGQIVAVQDINLSIYSGEILVLMGLSGSGKSSLLRCLNGMNGRGVGKIRGEISFIQSKSQRSIDLIQCRNDELKEIRRKQISMVFQQFGLMPWRTVEENVSYPLEIQNLNKSEISRRVKEKLELVGLSEWKTRYPYELSGGMQQRVGLARAFATEASVLLMDEPFSALDPIHRRHLQDEVLRLQKKLKKTIIFVSHDFHEARRIADRVAILHAGKILQVATPDEMIQNPVCQQVKDFLPEQYIQVSNVML